MASLDCHNCRSLQAALTKQYEEVNRLQRMPNRAASEGLVRRGLRPGEALCVGGPLHGVRWDLTKHPREQVEAIMPDLRRAGLKHWFAGVEPTPLEFDTLVRTHYVVETVGIQIGALVVEGSYYRWEHLPSDDATSALLSVICSTVGSIAARRAKHGA